LLSTPFLFIDIDETLVRPCPPGTGSAPGQLLGQSLLWLMQQAAMRQKGMTAQDAERIIRQVHDSIRWWCFTDFIRALNLDAHRFWQYAYEAEADCFEPVSTDVPYVIPALHKAGYKLFITTNNAGPAILHKLRLAGLAEIWGSPYFLQYFGPPQLHCMKAEAEFWRRTLAQTGIVADQAMVIGDSWTDDVLAPREAGLRNCIHLDAQRRDDPLLQEGVWRVGNWRQIAQRLLNPAAYQSLLARLDPHPTLTVRTLVQTVPEIRRRPSLQCPGRVI